MLNKLLRNIYINFYFLPKIYKKFALRVIKADWVFKMLVQFKKNIK